MQVDLPFCYPESAGRTPANREKHASTTIIRRRPLAGLVTALLLLANTGAAAVTLGQARVLSYLNQPLNAEIPLVGLTPGEEEGLRLRVANQTYFERLGIAYTRAVTDLQFNVVQNEGRWVVRVTTPTPVTEPFLDFPVQMAWSGGQLIRQYTRLLDPPSRPTTVRSATVTQSASTAPRQHVRRLPPPGLPPSFPHPR